MMRGIKLQILLRPNMNSMKFVKQNTIRQDKYENDTSAQIR